MRAAAPSSSGSIRDRFCEDHERVEALLDRFVAAVKAKDGLLVTELWRDCEAGLRAHMDAEERCVLPLLQRSSARTAGVLIQEHRHIRTRLAELHLAVEAGTLRLETARSFADEVKAHARSEDRLLYQWVETQLDEPERASLVEAFVSSLDGGFAATPLPVKG